MKLNQKFFGIQFAIVLVCLIYLVSGVRHDDDYTIMIDDILKKITKLQIQKDIIFHIFQGYPGDAFVEHKDYYFLYNEDYTPQHYSKYDGNFSQYYQDLKCNSKTTLFKCSSFSSPHRQMNQIYGNEEKTVIFPIKSHITAAVAMLGHPSPIEFNLRDRPIQS